ncbi:hypothetical protein FYJ44_08830 [Desulfovibrio sp. PG-178-WT-4]|uniref:Uncharacterized protein n=1 Tax=Desulfovibrio porci TaxID=2605782 RepID=A0A6L5XLX9_9BACT|nr:hypothetical protein [Desulfovibrio porci]MDY3810120.1 hypothetical protein [Desulfovibrio porci]MSS28135.1 hypothetical protein [Desulfovibrio porci]
MNNLRFKDSCGGNAVAMRTAAHSKGGASASPLRFLPGGAENRLPLKYYTDLSGCFEKSTPCGKFGFISHCGGKNFLTKILLSASKADKHVKTCVGQDNFFNLLQGSNERKEKT